MKLASLESGLYDALAVSPEQVEHEHGPIAAGAGSERPHRDRQPSLRHGRPAGGAAFEAAATAAFRYIEEQLPNAGSHRGSERSRISRGTSRPSAIGRSVPAQAFLKV